MILLEGRGLRRDFGGLSALSNLSFEVRAGEIYGLIGPNGAGKTTLFNLLSGMLPPSAGTILYRGTDITRLRPDQICRLGIARTYQIARPFAGLTVLQNVRVAAHFARMPRPGHAVAEAEASRILEFAGLGGKAHVRARDLTLAERKRLEVARALATRPTLLLLDEVMAGLTPVETALAIELVRSIWRMGITIVMVEHVMKAVMALSHRVLVLHHGVKIAEGTPAEVVADPRVIEAYLGRPVREPVTIEGTRREER